MSQAYITRRGGASSTPAPSSNAYILASIVGTNGGPNVTTYDGGTEIYDTNYFSSNGSFGEFTCLVAGTYTVYTYAKCGYNSGGTLINVTMQFTVNGSVRFYVKTTANPGTFQTNTVTLAVNDVIVLNSFNQSNSSNTNTATVIITKEP